MDETAPDGGEVNPTSELSCALDELLERMTAETFHEIMDTGPAIGQEIW